MSSSGSPSVPDPDSFKSTGTKDPQAKYSVNSPQALYASNKGTYEKLKANIDSKDVLKIIERYNNQQICLYGVCNERKILLPLLRNLIRLNGFKWDISTKCFVARTLLKRKAKKKIPKTILKSIQLDVNSYKILMLRSITEEKSYSIIINQLIISSSSTEMTKLAKNSLSFNRRNRVLELNSSVSSENPA
jgi:hypothetical protein